MRSPIGLGAAGQNLILDPRTPLNSAFAFTETKYSHEGTCILLHHGGVSMPGTELTIPPSLSRPFARSFIISLTWQTA